MTTPFYFSKTFWVNVAALASLVFPAAQDFLSKNPETTLAALAAVNVLLRFVSSGKVGLKDDTKPAGEINSSTKPTVLGLLFLLGACGALASCGGYAFSLTPEEGLMIKGNDYQVIVRQK